jgi:hypothetical protein
VWNVECGRVCCVDVCGEEGGLRASPEARAEPLPFVVLCCTPDLRGM